MRGFIPRQPSPQPSGFSVLIDAKTDLLTLVEQRLCQPQIYKKLAELLNKTYPSIDDNRLASDLNRNIALCRLDKPGPTRE